MVCCKLDAVMQLFIVGLHGVLLDIQCKHKELTRCDLSPDKVYGIEFCVTIDTLFLVEELLLAGLTCQ